MLYKEIEEIFVIFLLVYVVLKNVYIYVYIILDGFKLNIYVMVLMYRKFKYINIKIKILWYLLY